jgi:hypothetical protein
MQRDEFEVCFGSKGLRARIAATLWLIALAGSTPIETLAATTHKTDPVPRSADGHVDLEGNWKNSNLTALERSPEYPDLLITAEQAERIKTQYLAPAYSPNSPDDPGRLLENRTIEPIRGQLHSSLIIEPADGKIPWNEAYKDRSGQIRKRAMSVYDNPEDRSPIERCLNSNGVAPMIPNNDDNLYKIVQTPDVLVIVSESVHDARMIRMNSHHSPPQLTSWLGDSIAWWEADTLVVETKYFATHSAVRMNSRSFFLVSPQTTVMERFTRVSDRELNYVFTVSDPTFYLKPWTGESHLLRTKDSVFEFACQEGNYSMSNILAAARQQEEAKPPAP